MITDLPNELIKHIFDYLDEDDLLNLSDIFPNFIKTHYKEIDIYNSINNKRNVFITGPGGCGKSYILKKIALKYQPEVTASTGVSAININGRTLHSFMGLGIDVLKRDVDTLVKRIRNKKKDAAIIRCRLLIIDEISMIGSKFFDKISIICKKIRKSYLPFGGIQLVISGDFLQLPPIHDDWVFKSETWKLLQFKIIELNIPYRFTDSSYWKMLQRIRYGKLYKNDHLKLKQCLQKQLIESDIKPTILYSKKINVDDKNKNEMLTLSSNETVVYDCIDKVLKNDDNNSLLEIDNKFQLLAPNKVILKIGAQVMLKRNLGDGLCNGSRGVVKDLFPDYVTVKFISHDKEINIERIDYKYTNCDESLCIVRYQIPLILAWALTIHSCQGSTLDLCEIDIGNSVFEDGQAYVALSRVRNWDGLYLKYYSYKSIKANTDAVDFYKKVLQR